jgi:hypothetical protein
VIDFDSFIPDEIMSAPEHPLAQSLVLPLPTLPNANSASSEEICQIQQSQRLPGVVKRIIPLDTETSWEYGWCVPGRLLLAEDVELMLIDRDRVESILEKLVWLFGEHCFGEDSHRQGDQPLLSPGKSSVSGFS